MATTIGMTRVQIRDQIREQVDLLLDNHEIDPKPEPLTAQTVVEAYRANETIRDAIHEAVSARDLVREKRLDVGEIFEREHIREYVENDDKLIRGIIDNLDLAEIADRQNLAIDDIFSESDIQEYVLDNWSPREVFGEGDLELSALRVAEEAPEDVLKEIFSAAFNKNGAAARLALASAIHEVPDDVADIRDALFNARVEVESWATNGDTIPTKDLVAIFDSRVDFRDAVFGRLDENRDGFVEQRNWHAGDLFTKVDLATALLDYEDDVTAETAAKTFLGTLSGDFGDDYIRGFVSTLANSTFNVRPDAPAKPDAKQELKALLTKLLEAL